MALEPREGIHLDFFGTLIICTIVLGTIFNGIAIIFFYTLVKRSKSFNDALICSVAVADFIQSLFAYTLNCLWVTNTTKDPKVCIADGFLTHWLAVCSISHLAIMAYERYKSISEGYRRQCHSLHATLAMLSIAWLYALFWTALPLFGWSTYNTANESVICGLRWNSRDLVDTSYATAIFIADFALPLGVIVVCYVKVFVIVRTSNRTIQNAMEESVAANPAKSTRMVKEEKNLIMVVFMLITTFVISWLPYAIAAMISLAGVEVTGYYLVVPAYFAKVSVLYNPVIYAFKHTKFKQECKKLFGRENAVSGRSPNTSFRMTDGTSVNETHA